MSTETICKYVVYHKKINVHDYLTRARSFIFQKVVITAIVKLSSNTSKEILSQIINAHNFKNDLIDINLS